MGKKIRMEFDLNTDGVAELLKDPELGKELAWFGDNVARRATAAAEAAGFRGAKYNAKSFLGHDRQRVHVAAQNRQAFRAEKNARILTRQKGRGR